MPEHCDCPVRLVPIEDDWCFHCGRRLLPYDEWAALMVERYEAGQRELAGATT